MTRYEEILLSALLENSDVSLVKHRDFLKQDTVLTCSMQLILSQSTLVM